MPITTRTLVIHQHCVFTWRCLNHQHIWEVYPKGQPEACFVTTCETEKTRRVEAIVKVLARLGVELLIESINTTSILIPGDVEA